MSESLKNDVPPVRALVETGDQVGGLKVVLASTTRELFVPQEMVKPKQFVCTPKVETVVRITGCGSSNWAVGRSPKVVLQPVVPGR